MKRILITLLLAVCVSVAFAQADPPYPTASAPPLNITAAEYFIDTDPGIGSGTAISIATALDISNAAATININGLSNGVHRLYIRTRNTEGVWSITNTKDFLYDFTVVYDAPPATPQNVVAAEYFIDTDPGFGNGTAIAISPGLDLNNVPLAVNTVGLSNGIHRLYIRTKNNEGRWSMTMVKDFGIDFDVNYPASLLPPQNIIAAEYFFDTDPGFGSATGIAITPGLDLNNVSLVANTSALGIGIHRLYIRTKNNEGQWSMTMIKEFGIDFEVGYPASPAAAQNIIAAEYFFDTDPGFGNATAISITPGLDLNNIPVAANTTGLVAGIHRIYFRTKNLEGRWSMTSVQDFSIENAIAYTPAPPAAQNIVAAEYFVDTDPGFGNATAIAVTPGVDVSNVPVSVNTSALADGQHFIYLRTKNAEGRWSMTNIDTFAKGPLGSWTIDPASGHVFTNTPVNAFQGSGFTIRNTGNIPVTLSSVTLSDPAFGSSFIPGTIIPVNGSASFTVVFAPTAPGSFTAQVKIKSSTPGVDSVTTTVSGNGFLPGTPPVIQYVPASPFNGIGGVNPSVGQTGTYTYKVLYKSAINHAPGVGFPKVGIDLNGDQDFTGLGEGVFSMAKEGSSVDYVTGVTYTYSFTHINNNAIAGYRFFAQDDNGDVATAANTAYVSGPLVTDQQLDLRIFASDITFSKPNPSPGETFTVTATIHNSTAMSAVNVPVKFYRDTILIDSAILPAVNAFSSSNISKAFSFGAEGFYPIKVFIDPDITLADNNRLNNFAIRPVIVGSPVLPGGITVTTSATVQNCPAVKVLISGNAVYFGTGTATSVAGAQVTINTGTEILTTTTDAAGNYSLALNGVTCGGSLVYTVTITDFTFTSSPVTNVVSVPCPAPNACALPRSNGGIGAIVSTDPCANQVGSNAPVNFKLKYRERDISNMWSGFDQIIADTLKVFKDGVLFMTLPSADFSHGPGNEVIIPVSIPLSSTTPVTITGELSYTYIEYLQIPTSIYHGNFTRIVTTGGGTIAPQPNLPDLTFSTFTQNSFTSFSFDEVNIRCGDAGSHTVQVFDSIPGNAPVLIKTATIPALGGKNKTTITHSDPTFAPGTHFIKVIADAGGTVTEESEGNNIGTFTLVVPLPDLSITKLRISPTSVPAGSGTTAIATIKNPGKASGTFMVRFMVNGVQAGALKSVTSLGEKSSIDVQSDVIAISNADNTCGPVVEAFADINTQVTESDETNNSKTITLSPDLAPYQLPSEVGSAGNPAVVRVNTMGHFFPATRNLGQRDVSNITVRYSLNGNFISADNISTVRAGEPFASFTSFDLSFSTPGDYIVKVTADTANSICESDETNNEGNFHIRVTDSKPDFEVLSQYISPTSLNPNSGQNINIVGTVRNTGGKVTTASVLRFMVDDLQLGADVPINALQPGRDTTVAATVTYSSIIPGVKIMKIIADPLHTLDEEREDNNEATRALIVGDAPDMTHNAAQPLTFNPNGFNAGDSVLISYKIKNAGSHEGTAWARISIYDQDHSLTAIDSVQFTLQAGANMEISKRMFFAQDTGLVVVEIVNCTPLESNLLNNLDSLRFGTVAKLKAATTVNNLDMKAGAPDQLPGWIGGKIMLGDFDLTVNGTITNFDTAHFIITNGAGKLKIVNSIPQNIFPVGVSQFHSNFVKLNNVGTPDNFSVRVVPYVLKGGTGGDTVRTGNVNRTWFIDEQTAGGSSATVEMFWNTADELPGFDRLTSRTAHFITSWQLGSIGVAVADSIIGRYSKAQAGYDSFSPFTVTSGNGASLPLQFISFKAERSGSNVQLTWVTDNEINTSHFDVEYSQDGIVYVKIAELAAANSGLRHQYDYTHVSPSGSILYYRIKQVDKDSRFTYSTIVKVVLRETGPMVLYPNPASTFIQLKNLPAGEVREIRITAADGKLLMVLQPNASMRYNISRLQNGLYILTVIKKNGDGETRSLIKE